MSMMSKDYAVYLPAVYALASMAVFFPCDKRVCV